MASNRKIEILVMKLVIATGTFPPEVSGQATFVGSFVDHFKNESITPIIVSYGEKSGPKQTNVFRISRNVFRHLIYWFILWRQSRRADIIYAQDLFSSGLPAALAKRGKMKFVIRLGGDFLWEKMVNSGRCQLPLSQYYQQNKNWRERFYLAIYRFILDRAAKIIFNTDWQQSIYKKVFELPENKLAVITNPTNLQLDNFLSGSVASQNLIYAGRFIPLKNLSRLIMAFKPIKTDKKLILIGQGPQAEELKKLSADDPRIEFWPIQPREKLLFELARCYLVVLPSLSELNPNLALEAFNLKKPVLLTQEVGLSEAVKKHFKLINPLDINSIKAGLEYFLVPENYRRYINQDPKFLADDNWSKVIGEHLKIFSALIS